MAAPARSRDKIGVLIEDHFDEIEYRELNQYFPEKALFTKAFSWLDHYLGPTL